MTPAKKTTAREKPARYRAAVGVEIGGDRFEPGETITAKKVPKWMIDQHKVEKIEAG